MIYIKETNIKIQVSKSILDDILNSIRFHVELKASKHWKKELLDIELIDNKLVGKLKDITTISISNGLHPQLPIYHYNCIRYFLNEDTNKFIFQLGEKIVSPTKNQQEEKSKKTTQLNLF